MADGETRTLAIFAHPDDELSASGTLRESALLGQRVNLAFATRGEAGLPPLRDRSPTTREVEACEAAAVLGIERPEFLGYTDSGPIESLACEDPRTLFRADEQALVAAIGTLVHKHRPTIVITHEPNGWYGHRDHVRLSRAVTRAIDSWDAQSIQRPVLEYAVIPWSAFQRLRLAIIRSGLDESGYELFAEDRDDSDLQSMSRCHDVGVHWQMKLESLRCHRSQYGFDHAVNQLPPADLSNFLRHEYFLRAHEIRHGGPSQPTKSVPTCAS